MFGNLGNLTDMMKSARELQDRMGKLQEALASKRHEGVAGGGMVRAVVDGRGTLVDIKIDAQAVDDIELLEDLIKGAVSAAAAKSQEEMKNEMGTLTGGMDLPGLSQMLGGN